MSKGPLDTVPYDHPAVWRPLGYAGLAPYPVKGSAGSRPTGEGPLGSRNEEQAHTRGLADGSIEAENRAHEGGTPARFGGEIRKRRQASKGAGSVGPEGGGRVRSTLLPILPNARGATAVTESGGARLQPPAPRSQGRQPVPRLRAEVRRDAGLSRGVGAVAAEGAGSPCHRWPEARHEGRLAGGPYGTGAGPQNDRPSCTS